MKERNLRCIKREVSRAQLISDGSDKRILTSLLPAQQAEKARLQAEAKAAEDAHKRAEAEAVAEEKRRRELDREAAREALLKVRHHSFYFLVFFFFSLVTLLRDVFIIICRWRRRLKSTKIHVSLKIWKC